MKFAVFDHVDRSDDPLAKQFDERLTYVAAADEAGFYCYHVAEHHATPLNMVPVPGVYLGAVARATKRIRLGPLVYLLPLYSPLGSSRRSRSSIICATGGSRSASGAACRRSSSTTTRSIPRPRAPCSSMRSIACSPASRTSG